MKTGMFVFLFCVTSLWALTPNDSKNPLEVRITSSPAKVSPQSEFNLQLNLQLPKSYHAYEDQFKVVILEPSGLNIKTLTLNPIKKWFDKFSKKDRTGIEDNATMSLTIETPNRFVDDNGKLVLELTYQACSDSFCLFPKSKDITIPVTFEGKEQSIDMKMPMDLSVFTVEGFTHYLSQSWWLALLVAFFAGIITSFTPCIFPMIPITLAILNNHSEQRTRWTNFLISVIYVLGIATTYSVLGLIAAKSGMLFGSLLSNSYILVFVCGLFFLMALSMYGAFELQLPNFITQRFSQGSKQKGYAGAYLSGLFAGIVASPCVGPVLVAILTYVSTQQNAVFGFFLLFTYALGLGLIFIVLGVSTELTKKLPRSGPWLDTTKQILGSLMMIGFFYYLDLLIPLPYLFLVLGIFLIVFSSIFGAFSKPGAKKRELVRKGLMQAILILGFYFLVIGTDRLISPTTVAGTYQDIKFNKDKTWTPFSDDALKLAQTENKPVIIDFFADWCAACWDLEDKVFSTPEFLEKTKGWSLLKMDATKDSQILNELKKKYGIVGLPTILFFDSKGNWIKLKTLTEFETKEKFFKRIDGLK